MWRRVYSAHRSPKAPITRGRMSHHVSCVYLQVRSSSCGDIHIHKWCCVTRGSACKRCHVKMSKVKQGKYQARFPVKRQALKNKSFYCCAWMAFKTPVEEHEVEQVFILKGRQSSCGCSVSSAHWATGAAGTLTPRGENEHRSPSVHLQIQSPHDHVQTHSN